jgi:hypothetical protein
MLRSFKGTWRWHRKAEDGHPPSVCLVLQHIVKVLTILSVQVIEPVKYGRFLFCARANVLSDKKLAVIGSYLSCIGNLIGM